MTDNNDGLLTGIGRVALGDLLRRSAARSGARVALIEGERRTTYAELDATANRFANHLLGRGLARGAKVAMLCNNSTAMVAAIFGIQKAGLVWVPINTMLGADDVDYILGHAEVALVVIDDSLLANAGLAA
ncbi:MAG: AMP-binding protein, partial [Ferrovibrionaceae bacterium]